jgi:hypothetical protein
VSVYRSDPAAPGANIRRRQVGSSGGRLEHAVDVFNASRAGQTVAGLTRSLGRPRISVGAAAGSSTQARITVAWELCWYQWGVEPGAADTVFEIAKGEQVEQLDRSARHWNATVGEEAQIVFGGAGAPRRRRRWLRRR